MDRDTVFLDIETTSLRRPWADAPRQVWDVGYVTWKGGDRAKRYETQFYVEVETSNADPFALRLGRFYERYPTGRFWDDGHNTTLHRGALLTRRTAAKHLSMVLRDVLWVGNNPRFDEETLAVLCNDEGYLLDPYYHLVDLWSMSLGAVMAKGTYESEAMPYKSEDLSALVGTSAPAEGESHSALVDARWNERWYAAMLGGGTDTEA